VEKDEIVKSRVIKSKQREGKVIYTSMRVMAIWEICSLQENLNDKVCELCE